MLTPGLCYKDIRPGTPEGGVYIGKFVSGDHEQGMHELKYYFVNSYGKKITIRWIYYRIDPRPENPEETFDQYFQETPCLELKKTGIPAGELVENKCYNLETPDIIPRDNYVGKFRHQASNGDYGPYIEFESIVFTKNEYPYRLPGKTHYTRGDSIKDLFFAERPCRTIAYHFGKLGDKIGRAVGRPAAAPAVAAANYGSSEEHPEANDYWAQQSLERAWHPIYLNRTSNNNRRNYLLARVNRTTRRRANAINRQIPAFIDERRARNRAANERDERSRQEMIDRHQAEEAAAAGVPATLNEAQNASKKFPEEVLEYYEGPECPICQSALIDPTTLPCGHSFCRAEIRAVRQRNPDATCPMCRAAIPVETDFPVNEKLNAEVHEAVAAAEGKMPKRNFMANLKARNNQAKVVANALTAKYKQKKGGKRRITRKHKRRVQRGGYWLECETCKGRGINSSGKKCKKCGGQGRVWYVPPTLPPGGSTIFKGYKSTLF